MEASDATTLESQAMFLYWQFLVVAVFGYRIEQTLAPEGPLD